jgi:hypothetical protein
VRRAAQRGNAVHADHVAACALDLCTHGDEAAREVDHLGLTCGVFDQGRALGERGRHHQVLGARDGDEVHHDARAAQALGLGVNVAMLDADGRAHGLQALHMLVYRAQADGAASGQRYARAAAARQQRPEDQHRRAHGLHELVRRRGIADLRRGEAHRGARALHFDAHLDEKPGHGGDIHEPRHVGEVERLGRKQRRAHYGERRVLCARNRNLALQRAAAADLELIHRPSTPPA